MNVKKIMRGELKGARISKSATKMLEEATAEYVKILASRAAVMAKHGGRKTINDEDMTLALSY